MGLPMLILSAQVKGAAMLKVRRQNDSFVSSFSGQLDPEIPGIQGDKRKFQVLG